MTPKELEQTIRSLMQRPMADAEWREQLEKLAAVEISFSGFTWLFGPALYRRNRVLFRPFILSRFSTYMTLPKWKVEDRKSTRLNSSHANISYAVFCLKKKKNIVTTRIFSLQDVTHGGIDGS